MKIDSLDELKAAFARWRASKKHVREAVPAKLLARAQQATKKHGVTAVVRATQMERSRLFRNTPGHSRAQHPTRRKAEGVRGQGPTFSRLELSAPSAPVLRPVAEVETGAGVTLRVFEETPEMMGLLVAVCGFGGMR